MSFKNAAHVRPAMIALALTVALSAGVPPAVAAADIPRAAPIADPEQYGDWIADVERPAAHFRGRYQPRLSESRELLSA